MVNISWQEACQIDTSLISLTTFFSSPPLSVQPLTGGLTNRCWKITLSSGISYVWRPTTTVTAAFGISRQREHQVLSALQTTGIAPQPVVLNTHGLLVEWLEGEALHDGTTPSELTSLLARVHKIDPQRLSIPRFDFTRYIEHYWQQLDEQYKTPAVIACYQRWRHAPTLEFITPVLCHCDLAGYNLVRSEKGMQVIDWEYATLADPRLDLALTIGAAALSLPEIVHHYCKQSHISHYSVWEEGVRAWQPRTQLMAMLWYLLAYQLWNDAIYWDYAQQIINEFGF